MGQVLTASNDLEMFWAQFQFQIYSHCESKSSDKLLKRKQDHKVDN